jgi:hypothetical protein
VTRPADIANQRTQRDAALAAISAAEDRIASLDAAIAQARRAGQSVNALQARRAAADRALQDARAEGLRLSGAAFDSLVDWLGQTPEQVVETCNDAFPFVLLPVRIETKFARTPQGTELRVRFFPDDIGVATPPTAVIQAEVVLGRQYWRARAASRHAPNNAVLRRRYEGAWTQLATRAGPWRAGYIIRATAPTNPDAPPGALEFDEPVAPDTPPVPRADLLPDRFVVIAYGRDTAQVLHEVTRAVGAPIPDDLVLGPSAQAETFLARDATTGRLIVPETLQWLVDFDAAERVGMALRMPVAVPHDSIGFDRVLAIGVRSATPPEQGPAALGELLAKHRDSNGCGIIRAGTPTNAPDSSGADLPPSDAEQLFAIEDAPPDITPGAGVLGVSDGARLCQLLGLDTEFVRRLPNAAATDIAEALAMNRALVPATLDDFVAEFLRIAVSPDTASGLHEFVVTSMSGRGLYPALRVGRQCYGIVLTSARRSFEPAPGPLPLPGAPPDIAPALHTLIAQHRPHWEVLARNVSHASQNAADPFALLLDVIGLEASSTTYASRRAVSDEFLHQRAVFMAAPGHPGTGDVDVLQQHRADELGDIDFPPPTTPTDPLLAFILFLRDIVPWHGPLVDRDPAVPLSERDPVGPYDGTHNYLWWLTHASREDLTTQHFIGADGTTVPAPTALLYGLLRHAMLAALERATLSTARQFGSQYFDVVDRDPLIANIGDEQHVLRRDYLDVDASRLGLTRTPVALADWALAAARVPDGARPATIDRLAEVHDAIAALADLPTARLERLMAEHVDVCSHRLDAWISALYGQRLKRLRAAHPSHALHLGAFGWLENVRPAARQPLPPDAVPAPLRDSANGPIFEDSANGGYIHAPSLMQAATAAVLRNGYLSHADSTQPKTFAVNLSSARMRAAVALTQGVRSGQPIGALLGYQLERGLHEGHPGVELDAFIGVLRDRFPLLSGRLSEIEPASSAETVEARNVVDGLALVETTAGLFYPYGIQGLPAAGTPAASAIAAEVDRLRDALDAVSDLLLAESVHQAVQGNLTRTRASLQALTAPEVPPEPDIVRTPRSGRVLTFRVALALDATATNGWSASLSPRARANPHLNHWLAQHLPPPGRIQWTAHDGTAAAAVQSLAHLGLEPIDVVLMSDDLSGEAQSSLERYVVSRFRVAHAVPDERTTVILPAPGTVDAATTLRVDFSAAAANGVSQAHLKPLLARLRALVTRGRPVHAGDWRRAADAALAEAGDPTGSATAEPNLQNFAELVGRLDTAASDLSTAKHALDVALTHIDPLRAALDANPETVDDPAWAGALNNLRRALFALAATGIAEALPADGLTPSKTLIDRLIGQARAVSAMLDDRLARAAELRGLSFADPLPNGEPERTRETTRRNQLLRQSYLDAARALFGPSFVILPLFRFTPHQASEIDQARSIVRDALALEEWLHSAARVRPRIAELTWAMAASRWSGHAIADPTIVQLPFSADGPWIGSAFGDALPTGEWLSLIVLDAVATAGALQVGLLFDDWTETVPTVRETTGIAFNFNRPNAVAPQALLVAIAPKTRGHWTFEDLVDCVHEALDLAKLRAVEPDALVGRRANEAAPFGSYFQVLPAILSQFTAGRLPVTDFGALGSGTSATRI